MARKKTKSKRKMPAHIVLPNGMWRFVKSGTKVKRKKTGVSQMARRRRTTRRVYTTRARRRSSGGFGGSKLTRGIFPVKGIIASALIGAGIATLQEKFLPQMIPYQSAVLGFAVGGIGGGIGAFSKSMLSGTTGTAISNY